MDAARDTNVDIEPVDAETYAFDPYPFDRDGLELTFEGRYLAPASAGDDVQAALESSPVSAQRIRLVAKH